MCCCTLGELHTLLKVFVEAVANGANAANAANAANDRQDGLAGRPHVTGPPRPYDTPRRRFPGANVSQVDGFLGPCESRERFLLGGDFWGILGEVWDLRDLGEASAR